MSCLSNLHAQEKAVSKIIFYGEIGRYSESTGKKTRKKFLEGAGYAGFIYKM